VRQLQRRQDQRAARLRVVEEGLLVDLLGLFGVADEHHLDLAVLALQEQVQQREEPLGEVLLVLVHRARHVHQAQHHRARGRRRHRRPCPVAAIDVFQERQRVAPPHQALVLVVDLRASRRVGAQPLLRQLAEAAVDRAAQRDAAGDRHAHGHRRREVARHAVAAVAGAPGAFHRHVAEPRALQVRQLEIVEEQRQELVARQHEGELVAAFALARLVALRAALARPALRPLDRVARHELAVAGQHEVAVARLLVVVQVRFLQAAAGDRDAPAAPHVLDRAFGELVVGRALDLVLEPAHEPFAVDRAAPGRVGAPVDDPHVPTGSDQVRHRSAPPGAAVRTAPTS
jgi:hypothetical protein